MSLEAGQAVARLGVSHGSEEGGLNRLVEGRDGATPAPREGAGGTKDACMDPNPGKQAGGGIFNKAKKSRGQQLEAFDGQRKPVWLD